MVKKLPCNVGDTVLITGLGTKIPHTKGQTAHEPQLLSHSAVTKTQCSQIYKNKY